MKKIIIIAVIAAAVATGAYYFAAKAGMKVASEKLKTELDKHEEIQYGSYDFDGKTIVIKDFVYENGNLYIQADTVELKKISKTFKAHVLATGTYIEFDNVDKEFSTVEFPTVSLMNLLTADIPNIVPSKFGIDKVIAKDANNVTITAVLKGQKLDITASGGDKYLSFEQMAIGIADVDKFAAVIKNIKQLEKDLYASEESYNDYYMEPETEEGVSVDESEAPEDYAAKYQNYQNALKEQLLELGVTHVVVSKLKADGVNIDKIGLQNIKGSKIDFILDNANVDSDEFKLLFKKLYIKGLDVISAYEYMNESMMYSYSYSMLPMLKYIFYAPMTLDTIEVGDLSFTSQGVKFDMYDFTYVAQPIERGKFYGDTTSKVKFSIEKVGEISDDSLIKLFEQVNGKSTGAMEYTRKYNGELFTEHYSFNMEKLFNSTLDYSLSGIDSKSEFNPMVIAINSLNFVYEEKGLLGVLANKEFNIFEGSSEMFKQFTPNSKKLEQELVNFYNNPEKIVITASPVVPVTVSDLIAGKFASLNLYLETNNGVKVNF